MRELLLVLNLKSASFLKGLFLLDIRAFLKVFSTLLIFGGFSFGVFFMARSVTAYLLDVAHIGSFLLHRFLSMALYVFFVTVNVGNLVVCYATLYRSKEVGFLISLPISHAKVFLLRFVDNFLYSSSTLALIGLAALLGYGSYFDMPWYFYFFTVFFVFLPFMLIAGVIAVVTLMGLIAIAARIGVRWLLGSLVVVYLSAVYMYFRTTNPVQLVGEVMKYYPDVNKYFGYLDPPLMRYLPNHWVTEFLYWSVNGNYERATPWFFLVFLTMVGLMAVAGLAARRFYYRTWLVASDVEVMRGSKGPGQRISIMQFGKRSRVAGVFLGTNPQTEALFKRDFWMFFRDPSQWLHFLVMVLLIMIFLVSLGSLDIQIDQPLMRTVSFLVIFLFNGFFIASVALRFVFPAVSLESDCFWSVRSSPLELRKLYFHKLGYAFALILVTVEILVLGSTTVRGDDKVLTAIAALCGGCVALALTSLHLGAGTYFAMFKEKNPVRVASSHGASLAFLGSMLYLAIVVGVLIVPLHRYFEISFLLGQTIPAWLYLPVGVVATISLLIFFVSTRLGLSSIQRDF